MPPSTSHAGEGMFKQGTFLWHNSVHASQYFCLNIYLNTSTPILVAIPAIDNSGRAFFEVGKLFFLLCLTSRPADVCCSCWFFGQCGLCVFARLFHHPCRLSNLLLHGKSMSPDIKHIRGWRKVMTTTLGRVNLYL